MVLFHYLLFRVPVQFLFQFTSESIMHFEAKPLVENLLSYFFLKFCNALLRCGQIRLSKSDQPKFHWKHSENISDKLKSRFHNIIKILRVL